MGHDVSVDAAGRAALTGTVLRAISFDHGAGPSRGVEGRGSFVAMFEADGRPRWVRRLTDGARTTEVEVEPNGRVTVAGIYVGSTAADASRPDRSVRPDVPVAYNYGELVMARYSASGSFLWASSDGSAADDRLTGLALAPGGGPVLYGELGEEWARFGDPGRQIDLRAATFRLPFLLRYDAGSR
jgi:hypothetical protein